MRTATLRMSVLLTLLFSTILWTAIKRFINGLAFEHGGTQRRHRFQAISFTQRETGFIKLLTNVFFGIG
jgi:hypothetical protein